jgi:lysophospholipase L1-like esterase
MELQGRVVFAGDSVTDCGWRDDHQQLGHGYVRRLAASDQLARCHVMNAGTGGDRLQDLEQRWDQDVLTLEPDVVSVMIGVNDTWRHFDSGEPSDISAFSRRYHKLLATLPPVTRLILLEPFVVAVSDEQEKWRRDLDPQIDAVHLLAEEFGAVLVPLDGILNHLAQSTGAASLAADGVHPTARGHQEIARAWLRAVIGS